MEKYFEWGTTRISIRTFIINDLDDNITNNVLKIADDKQCLER